MAPDGDGTPSGGERAYRRLLGLYPPAFRREYGADLLQAFRDRRREPRHRGPAGRARLGLLLVVDLVRSVPREWWRHLVHGGRAGRGRPREDGLERREGGMGMGIEMETVAQDLAYAWRSFRRRPGYWLAAVTTLAVGIAGATTMFSVLDRVVLRPLPYHEAGELVQVGMRYARAPDRLGSVAPAEIHGWQSAGSFEALAGSRLQALTLRGDGEPEILDGAGVSGSFFGLLGVDAALGRVFGPDEDREGAAPVAVLTWGLWQRRWGGDPSVIGRSLGLDGTPFTVVGVLPRDYVPPEAIHHDGVEVYFPLAHVADDVSPTVIESAFLQAVGRLATGVGVEAARDELAAVEADLLGDFGFPADARTVGIEPLHERTVGDFGRTLLPFLGAVLLLLLVACANVANLSLVRATERGREMSLRSALGAGRVRLVRQLLTESLALAAAAGVAGALAAWGAVAAFRRFSPDGLPRASEVAVDPRVLAFALGLALLTGLVFGLAPVLHVLRSEEGAGLGGRGSAAGSARREGRVRALLVAGEVALALVLVVGAGLLARSFMALVDADLGFEPAGSAYMMVAPEGERWESPEARLALYRGMAERLRNHPGVVAVGGTSNLPLSGNESVTNVTIEGHESADDLGEDVSYNRVLPGFFEATGTRLLEGRAPAWTDGGEGVVPAVINETMARSFWAGRRAVGGRLHLGSRDSEGPRLEVVGVVEDVRQLSPGQPPVPQLYVPFTAFTTGIQTLVVRAGPGDTDLIAALRGALAGVAPELPVRRIGTMEALLSERVVRPRFFALVLGTFAAVSLLLAVVGVYGTIAYAVRQRTRELGVRMALGADRRGVRTLVMRQGLALTALGLAGGVLLSLLATRLLEGLVYGVTPTDPATLAGAALALAAAATVASWIPALRATRIDPSEALRAE